MKLKFIHLEEKQKAQIILTVIIVLLLVAAVRYSGIVREIIGLEGSHSDIRKMQKAFDSGEYKKFPHGFKHTYPDGSWIYVLATDSHHGGGTIGVLESSGKKHFYFGHVCGFGEGVGLNRGKDAFDPDQNSYLKKVK